MKARTITGILLEYSTTIWRTKEDLAESKVALLTIFKSCVPEVASFTKAGVAHGWDECRKDAEVIDESPAAYKSIDALMEAQADLVEIVHTLKQVVCVKG